MARVPLKLGVLSTSQILERHPIPKKIPRLEQIIILFLFTYYPFLNVWRNYHLTLFEHTLLLYYSGLNVCFFQLVKHLKIKHITYVSKYFLLN